MTPSLTITDFAALSPLLILLSGALLLLVFEKRVFYFTFFILVLALGAAFFSPASNNPILTNWLNFDPLGRFFSIFFLVIGLGITLLSSPFKSEYFFLLLSALFGLILIGYSADFLTLFLGLETLSISLYILCGYRKDWTFSTESAMKYFFIGSLAAATLLYGIALIYGATGTTRLEGLFEGHGPLFISGIALVTLALAVEAAVVPFHFWAPDVYDGATTPVTAFMAVGTKVGAFAAFVRVFKGFDALWSQGIVILAIITLIYANFVAIRQKEMRRFFAYSGISHAGFLLIPLAVGAIPPLLFYLVVYALSTLGCFAVLTFLDNKNEGVSLNDLKGLFKKSPLLASLFILCLLTLAGIPPTVGFFAKFYLFKVAFEAHYYTLVVIALLTTILSAFYYLRIVAVMLADAPDETSPRTYWPAVLLGAASFLLILLFSWFPAPLYDLAALTEYSSVYP